MLSVCAGRADVPVPYLRLAAPAGFGPFPVTLARCGVPRRAVPCRAVPCRAVPCRAVPCRAVPACYCRGCGTPVTDRRPAGMCLSPRCRSHCLSVWRPVCRHVLDRTPRLYPRARSARVLTRRHVGGATVPGGGESDKLTACFGPPGSCPVNRREWNGMASFAEGDCYGVC